MRPAADINKLCNVIARRTEAATRHTAERIRRSEESERLDFDLRSQTGDAIATSRELLDRKRS